MKPTKPEMATIGKQRVLTHLMTEHEAACGFKGKKFTRLTKSLSKVTCRECREIIERYSV